MMREIVVSDLHLEHYKTVTKAMRCLGVPDNVQEDTVLILAGDVVPIAKYRKYIKFFEHLARIYPAGVVWVPGNHEYYGGCVETSRPENLPEGIHFLERESVIIDRVLYVGCTLWAELNSVGSDSQSRLSKFPDFRFVDCKEGVKQTIRSVSDFNDRDTSWLRHELFVAGFIGHPYFDTVSVITHFAPTTKYIAAQYSASEFNQFFSNALEKWFLPGGIALQPIIKNWYFGHTHVSFEDRIQNLNLKCNPAGYPVMQSLENPKFAWPR